MLKLPQPRKVTLDSGVTLLYQGNPYSPTIAFGAWITRGSRDETHAERGLSHLLEHMVFRGTRKRDALRIALDLEAIGGQWDAFTSREMTCYNARVLDEHFESLADIFADFILDPTIPEDAFRLERKVVQEEIRGIKDSPEEFTHELFMNTIFKGHPLGYPVAGTLSGVGRYSREDLLAFHRKVYTASNTVIGFVGNIPLRRVARIIEREFRFPRRRGRRAGRAPSRGAGRTSMRRRPEWSQTHACIGSKTVPASHRDRYALAILSGILGGGVSSRLFQSMRERNGLVYSVYSHASFWRDAGVLYSFFSVDPNNLRRALDIFHTEIRDLEEGHVRDEELESARATLKGAVIFGSESATSRLFSLFQSDYHLGRYVSVEELIAAIDRVDSSDIARITRRYLDRNGFTYTSCGPANL
ncbi:MAG TPA: insulinase family protein [Candidatus Eisenbacteria bacterium]|uniref:Insulinase family protein n=1 Tax=Eiseniibacteriota bacterium TaxID=2212470 RepID=A0A7V2AVF8_UNCEI|nr:insulinase family protein [Candidatus Eisenbacteria bacterium]